VEGLDHCLNQISLIEDAMASPDSAYLFRTRLNRLTLSCARMVARDHGLEEPVLPGRFEAAPSMPPNHRRIADCITKLFTLGELLGQPSEPFGNRWVGHRDDLAVCLLELRRLLLSEPSDSEPG
jgi:hypothetical protein